jgi:hypothetical protein
VDFSVLLTKGLPLALPLGIELRGHTSQVVQLPIVDALVMVGSATSIVVSWEKRVPRV